MINVLNDPIATLLGDWSKNVNFESILFRIILSLIISAIIGWERSSKRHAAGLRTFIVITLGCTVCMLIDSFMANIYGSYFGLISAASIIAVATLSSNTVLFNSRSKIKGLTTSAGLFVCGIIGLTIGAGMYTLTFIAFIGLLISLSFFPAIEKYLKDRSNHFEIHLELKSNCNLQNFVSTVRELGLRIDDIESNPAYINSGLSVYSISVSITNDDLKKYKTHGEIIKALSTLEYVSHIEEMS